MTPYQRAYDRMADCRTIAQLRPWNRKADGTDDSGTLGRGTLLMRDVHYRLLLAYARAGTWYWGGREGAERELTAFIQDHLTGIIYRIEHLMSTVLDHLERDGHLDREGVLHKADIEADTDSLIRLFKITAEELARLPSFSRVADL